MSSIETSTSIITYDSEEGFLRVVVKANYDMEVEHAKKDMDESAKLVNGKRVPVLVDGRKMTYHSKEVRDFYANKERAESITAMAIMVDSTATRIIGNFFIKINKPHFPTRLFEKENLAELWLKEVLRQHYSEKTLVEK